MAARITAEVGVTRVVVVRLDPTPAQIEVLRGGGCGDGGGGGHCGRPAAVSNTLLSRVNLAQRVAERSHGRAGHALAVGDRYAYGREKPLCEHRDEGLPWWDQVPWPVPDLPGRQHATGPVRFTSRQARLASFRRQHGRNVGPVAGSLPDTGITWIGKGGRVRSAGVAATAVPHRQDLLNCLAAAVRARR